MIKSVAIAIPTYNEAKNISRLIAGLGKAGQPFTDIAFTIMVIDDNSPDGTAIVANKLAKKPPASNFTITVLRRAGKEGLGKAYVDGFQKLLTGKFDYILQMDADLSHNPKYLKDFLAAAQAGHDFIVASRYMPGGGTPDWAWHRKLLSRGGNLYTRAFLGSTLTDYTGGFNMYKTTLLRRLNLESLRSGGYGFLVELKYRALQHAASPYQIPIVFRDRQHGKSKIPKSTLLKNFILVPSIRLAKKST